MSKQDFIDELRKGLSGLPQNDIEERLAFYSEMIDDRTEEGLSEDDAICEIGTVNEVVSQIVAEYPLSKLVKERVRPKRTLRAWEVVLLLLGSPVWLSLLIAAFAVVLSAYVVIWSVVISLWAIEVSLAACSLAGVISVAVLSFQGNRLAGIAMLGAGIFCVGLSIFCFFACKEATKGTLLLTKKIALGIKSLFIGKESIK
ncbi:MAG: DUF1700 domain-containing protein [Acutalibacteraceae bacterium]